MKEVDKLVDDILEKEFLPDGSLEYEFEIPQSLLGNTKGFWWQFNKALATHRLCFLSQEVRNIPDTDTCHCHIVVAKWKEDD